MLIALHCTGYWSLINLSSTSQPVGVTFGRCTKAGSYTQTPTLAKKIAMHSLPPTFVSVWQGHGLRNFFLCL